MKMFDGREEHEVSDYKVVAGRLASLNPELNPDHPSGSKYIELGPITFGFDSDEKLESVQVNHGSGLGFSNLFSYEFCRKHGIAFTENEEHILNKLVGLNVTVAGVAEQILETCLKRLSVPGTDCVYLHFDHDTESYDSEVLVEKDETLETLKAKLQEMAAKGMPVVLSHAS